MKRILVLFAIVYGQISGFVLTLTAALYLSSMPAGESVCARWGLALGACRAVVSLFLVVAFGVSAVLSVYRFGKDKSGEDDSKD